MPDRGGVPRRACSLLPRATSSGPGEAVRRPPGTAVRVAPGSRRGTRRLLGGGYQQENLSGALGVCSPQVPRRALGAPDPGPSPAGVRGSVGARGARARAAARE